MISAPIEIPVDGQVTYLKNVKLRWKPSVTSGGTADIYRGRHPDLGEVALKRLRPLMDRKGSKDDSRIRSEMATWASLNHPNILQFYGIYVQDGRSYLVSPWIRYGTLPHFLREHDPSADRMKFLAEGADALAYLHEKALIHGDIKGNNILVSKTRHALLCDFGLSGQESKSTLGERGVAGSTRWMSPELFKGSRKSPKSDVYAFGITIYEILSGTIPYHDLKGDNLVIRTVISGGRPPIRPAVSTTGDSYAHVWAVAQRCWQGNPNLRLSMNEVHEVLRRDSAQPPLTLDDALIIPPPTPPPYDKLPAPTYIRCRNDKPGDLHQYSLLQGFKRLAHWVSRLKFFAIPRSLPTATIIPVGRITYSGINFDSGNPVAGGGYCQIFQGTNPTWGVVALKRLRVVNAVSQDVARFESEVENWKVFDHPNILPFFGTFMLGGHVYFITRWAENGALPEYLKSNPNADRPNYILQIADALSYLHMKRCIHGDVKAQNILVASDRRPLLSDFGLSKAVSTLTLPVSKFSGSLRWASPELWNGMGKTLETDVYAFGMTIYQILSGNVPFYDEGTEAAVAMAVVLRDDRPPRNPPIDLGSGASYESIWDVAENCWKKEPDKRLTMAVAVDRLRSALENQDARLSFT
ncbi:hypothetical protein FRB99_006412 [Tulasnella sp. 403]|nr:hypothetical protein FRB99_006412 [Tulasnella sp. 403]